jgi:cytochrome c-type biogenesis protein CcmH
MIREVDERVARNESDDLTLQGFVQEYGPTVLAEPPAKGFNRVAWIMPVVFPLVSLYLLWEVVRRWRRRSPVATAGGPNVSDEFLARARNEAGKESDE